MPYLMAIKNEIAADEKLSCYSKAPYRHGPLALVKAWDLKSTVRSQGYFLPAGIV